VSSGGDSAATGHAFLAQEALHAAHGHATVVQQHLDPAHELHVGGPVVAPPAGTLHRPDLR
jgi:hypothetical protein